MRIALVAHGVHPRGGMERYFYELAIRLAREHQVEIFAIDCDSLPPGLEITVHRVPAPRRPILLRNLVFRVRSGPMVRAVRPDLVHCIGGVIDRAQVVTLQYCQAAWGQTLAEGGVPRLGGFRRWLQELSWRVNARFESAVARDVAGQGGLIACSARTAGEAAHFYGAAGAHVIHNAVDSEQFHPPEPELRMQLRQERGIGADEFVVLFVGEYVRKRLDLALEAVASIRDQGVACRLLVVGRGPEQGFRDQARRLAMADRVSFAGFLPEPASAFALADAFLFPSAYEPFGMVVVEAMASGLPVVISEFCGAAEVIEDGQSGLVIAPGGEVDGYAAALLGLARRPDLGRAMGARAREAVLKLNWDRVHTLTARVYADVKERDGGRRSLPGDNPG